MKLKRIIAALFATALLLAPVSTVDARASLCPFCGRAVNLRTRCGGIVGVNNLDDIGYDHIPIKIEECSVKTHLKGHCQVTTEYGMTVKYCPSCSGMTEITGIHQCHETHSYTGITSDICPY